MQLLFFASGLFAGIVGTTIGFGTSTIFLPLALLFFDFKPALTLVAFFHLFGSIGRVGFFRKSLDKNLLLQFGIPSVVFTITGALLVSHLPQLTLKGLLGLFLIAYSIHSLSKERIRLKPTVLNKIIGGSSSGFLAGLIGTGGALRAAFINAFHIPKEQYIATASAIAFAVDLTRIPVYLSQGFLNKTYLWFLPILFMIALLGAYIGRHIVKKIPQESFQKIVLVALLLIGFKFLIDWITA